MAAMRPHNKKAHIPERELQHAGFYASRRRDALVPDPAPTVQAGNARTKLARDEAWILRGTATMQIQDLHRAVCQTSSC